MNALYLEFSIYYFHTQVNHWLLRPWSTKLLREATVHSSSHYGRLTFTHRQIHTRQSLEVPETLSSLSLPLRSNLLQCQLYPYGTSLLPSFHSGTIIFLFMLSSCGLGPGNSHSYEDCWALIWVLITADLTTDGKVSWSFSSFCPILENFQSRLFHIENFQLFLCSGRNPQIAGTECIHFWPLLISEMSYTRLRSLLSQMPRTSPFSPRVPFYR